ncbi:MAG: hypothetical protein J6Y47_00045 [Bacteroidales bacterium]|nr:hypothetical protein [Bacteroidales bacterium]
MYTLTINIYKYDQFKWQEQVLLDASAKAEAKQKAYIERPSHSESTTRSALRGFQQNRPMGDLGKRRTIKNQPI